MRARIVVSLVSGFLASVTIGAMAFISLLLYLHHLASVQPPGGGAVVGGVFPCFILAVAGFIAGFVWAWRRH